LGGGWLNSRDETCARDMKTVVRRQSIAITQPLFNQNEILFEGFQVLTVDLLQNLNLVKSSILDV
jgi:hypothetical protein